MGLVLLRMYVYGGSTMEVLDPGAVEAGPLRFGINGDGLAVDHRLAGVLAGGEEPNAAAGVVAKAVEDRELAVAGEQTGIGEQDVTGGGADRSFEIGDGCEDAIPVDAAG